ncbi:hypothetical protein [Aliiroseovarius crassostreae]|uniref:hypothetical protein n=1 Tax=Aliiroseovarius crassostreae TaxID=154981 RepID=UPI00220F4471|nr:hypothetical protein [Aliiroseovarius crassostreae]UWP88130.1 hypothetical protein K3J57_09365 [Aliiroseovarius crassostreae]UWQ00749.1 hypothetical protein K3X44_09430 [Aliiroseovarius crassostreae]
MGRIAVLLATIMLGNVQNAQAGDAFLPMRGDEIRAALTDARVVYSGKDQGRWQLFHADGRTLYVAGAESWGRWFVKEDQYCSSWPPASHVDCYDMLRAGDQVRFVGVRWAIYEGGIK